MGLSDTAFLGVLTALVGGVLLAVGAQQQHRGVAGVQVRDAESKRGSIRFRQVHNLLLSRRWVLGVGLTGLAMALNLLSLGLAPLIVVQPLGVVALITTALLNAGTHGYRLGRGSILAMGISVAGIATFVTVAALTARDAVVSDSDIGAILVVLAGAVVVLALALALLHRRFPASLNVLAAAVLAGFVVTLAKAVVTRVSVGNFGWLTIVGLVALLAVAGGSQYFVQSAYASGPVDLIVAGMTTIDPLVAVSLGIVLLGETARTPGWAAATYALSGAVAITGVFLLARHHPQAVR